MHILILIILLLLVIQICAKTVSRTDMVQISLDLSMSGEARNCSIFGEFVFARSQRSKTFAKIRISAIYPLLFKVSILNFTGI